MLKLARFLELRSIFLDDDTGRFGSVVPNAVQTINLEERAHRHLGSNCRRSHTYDTKEENEYEKGSLGNDGRVDSCQDEAIAGIPYRRPLEERAAIL